MTTILALESSADACSVALWRHGEIQQMFELAPRQHTRLMLPLVDQLLSKCQCSLADIDAYAFGAGPGSFTGLRIAVGIVQGLAFAVDRPVVAVPSLHALALTAVRELNIQPGQTIAVAVDARMDEVYWACFSVTSDGAEPQDEVDILPHAAVPELQGDFIAVGSGWGLEALAPMAVNASAVYHDLAPQAYDLLPLAVQLFELGETTSAADAAPHYIRNTVSWKKLSEQ
ncbi:MAG TPA: tRNA (adenosine(37)-N6)-threonylcarbamoyltransferase complex dimerization subunit type 1 TsaB [Pseudomonadales bacterium]|nr:tRNA (adenosine(37)-N6)-threonylcarbamoyltransferase complex dimerization subunit type 1 TsaB [Pseudomonadales bacterium]